MSLFRLDASIRVEGSHGRAIADIVEQEWRNAHPGEPVIRRHAGVDPIPATAWATAVYAGRAPEESRTDEQQAALALAASLTDELVAADALLFAVPLYNFGVSQHFKTWVDMVITDPRMAAGTQPVLAGKPAVLVTVRGGNYRPGTPREGWDHATGWRLPTAAPGPMRYRLSARGTAAVDRGTGRESQGAGYARIRDHHPRRVRDITGGLGGKRHEITEPGGVLRLRVIPERHDVILGPHDQQRRRRDQVIFVADRLLVDHLEGERRGPGPPRVVRSA